MKVRIAAAGGQKRCVGPALHQPAVIQHQDLTRPAHGAQAMRHDETGAAEEEKIQGALDDRLGPRIHGARGLIQNQHRRVLVQGSGDGKTLSLPSRKLAAVVADERALNQIILNLISNAIKFTPEGGQVIVSSARTAEGELVIRVKDTGLGMTEQELATALEPFRQLPTSRKTGGTGLGLPLTKALVEANRAAFVIKSARNSGTLVEITFPPTRVLAN